MCLLSSRPLKSWKNKQNKTETIRGNTTTKKSKIKHEIKNTCHRPEETQKTGQVIAFWHVTYGPETETGQ